MRALFTVVLIATAITAGDAQAKTRPLYYKVAVSVLTETNWVMDGHHKCGDTRDRGTVSYYQRGNSSLYYSSSQSPFRKSVPVRVSGEPGELRLELMGDSHKVFSVGGRPPQKTVHLNGVGERNWIIDPSSYEEGADGNDAFCRPGPEGDKPDCGSRKFSGDFALVPRGLNGLEVRSRYANMFEKQPWDFCRTNTIWQSELLPVTGRRKRLAQDLVIAGRKRVVVVASNADKPLLERTGYDLPDGSYQHTEAETTVKNEVTFVRTTKKKANQLAEDW